MRGIPILLPETSAEWVRQTEQKLRFAAAPSWRRKLLNPSPNSKFHQERRLRAFLEMLPPGGLAMDVGASLRRVSNDVLCLDLMPTDGVDLVGDLHRIPLVEESLDAVVCTGVLEHVADPWTVIGEIRRVLKPGGRVYVSLPFLQGYHPSPTDFHRFTPEGARRLLEDFEIDHLLNTRGSGSTVVWVLASFLAELVSFGNARAYGLAKAAFTWLLMPVKLLDAWLTYHPFDHFITSGFTVIARKPGGGPT